MNMTREKAISTIENAKNFAYDDVYEEAFDMAINALKEQRKGHWVKHDTYYDCSLCGCVAPCTEFADSYLWKLSNFCPDCGCRMESEVEE